MTSVLGDIQALMESMEQQVALPASQEPAKVTFAPAQVAPFIGVS